MKAYVSRVDYTAGVVHLVFEDPEDLLDGPVLWEGCITVVGATIEKTDRPVYIYDGKNYRVIFPRKD